MSRRVLICVSCAMILRWATAEVVELKPVADTTLFQVAPGNNMGGHSHVAIGATSLGGAARGLFRFDLSSVPTNATVEGVSLTFHLPELPRIDPEGSAYALHRVLTAWGEGNKSGNQGAPAGSGEATWNHSALPTAWQGPGGAGNYVQDASATQILGPAPGEFAVNSTMGLISDVRMWIVAPEANFGWLVKSADESVKLTARRFASREATNGPVLRVEYSVQAGLDLEITSVRIHEGYVVIRWTGATEAVVVERRSELSGQWQEAGSSVAGEYTEPISDEVRFYRLRK